MAQARLFSARPQGRAVFPSIDAVVARTRPSDPLLCLRPAAIADAALRTDIKQYGSVVIAVCITLYFFRQNLIGIHESSGKALGIMAFTTAVVGLVLAWSGITPVFADIDPVTLTLDPASVDIAVPNYREGLGDGVGAAGAEHRAQRT